MSWCVCYDCGNVHDDEAADLRITALREALEFVVARPPQWEVFSEVQRRVRAALEADEARAKSVSGEHKSLK